jgi:hypothetical protein
MRSRLTALPLMASYTPSQCNAQGHDGRWPKTCRNLQTHFGNELFLLHERFSMPFVNRPGSDKNQRAAFRRRSKGQTKNDRNRKAYPTPSAFLIRTIFAQGDRRKTQDVQCRLRKSVVVRLFDLFLVSYSCLLACIYFAPDSLSISYPAVQKMASIDNESRFVRKVVYEQGQST